MPVHITVSCFFFLSLFSKYLSVSVILSVQREEFALPRCWDTYCLDSAKVLFQEQSFPGTSMYLCTSSAPIISVYHQSTELCWICSSGSVARLTLCALGDMIRMKLPQDLSPSIFKGRKLKDKVIWVKVFFSETDKKRKN